MPAVYVNCFDAQLNPLAIVNAGDKSFTVTTVIVAQSSREKSYPPHLSGPQHLRMITRTNTPPALSATALNQQSDAHRREDLKRLVPIWPAEADDLSLSGRRHIIRCLARALRAERRRGLAGHFAYNINRHAGLITIYKQERAALIALQIAAPIRAQKSPPKGGRF